MSQQLTKQTSSLVNTEKRVSTSSKGEINASTGVSREVYIHGQGIQPHLLVGPQRRSKFMRGRTNGQWTILKTGFPRVYLQENSGFNPTQYRYKRCAQRSTFRQITSTRKGRFDCSLNYAEPGGLDLEKASEGSPHITHNLLSNASEGKLEYPLNV